MWEMPSVSVLAEAAGAVSDTETKQMRKMCVPQIAEQIYMQDRKLYFELCRFKGAEMRCVQMYSNVIGIQAPLAEATNVHRRANQ